MDMVTKGGRSKNVAKQPWHRNLATLEKITQAYHMYLQRKTHREIGKALGIHSVTSARYIQKAKALMAGVYAEDMEAMVQAAVVERGTVVAEAWEEVARVEESDLARDVKARTKVELLRTIIRALDSIAEVTGLRQPPQVNQRFITDRRAIIVLGSEGAGQRLLEAKREAEAAVGNARLDS